jgi:murein DD-endopeptidase MepM/ murein hydrolase activator NlpD
MADSGTSTGELERLIASTGVDIDKLLGSLSIVGGQGGPYVALSSVKRPPADESKRIAELQRLVKTLPLGAPLAQYQLESGFGSRIDPINGRPSFHDGLDLAAAYRSPVFATAPGVVSFTGTKDAYGRVVEIDHGHGIVTRYAHLHRILVVRGQKVAAKQEIAELGSTGRSTGPHVHYEILIDGTAVDPAKFMKAGKSVVEVSTKQ